MQTQHIPHTQTSTSYEATQLYIIHTPQHGILHHTLRHNTRHVHHQCPNTTRHRTTTYHTIPRHTTLLQKSHDTIPHHTTPYHTTPYHTTLHCTNPHTYLVRQQKQPHVAPCQHGIVSRPPSASTHNTHSRSAASRDSAHSMDTLFVSPEGTHTTHTTMHANVHATRATTHSNHTTLLLPQTYFTTLHRALRTPTALHHTLTQHHTTPHYTALHCTHQINPPPPASRTRTSPLLCSASNASAIANLTSPSVTSLKRFFTLATIRFGSVHVHDNGCATVGGVTTRTQRRTQAHTSTKERVRLMVLGTCAPVCTSTCKHSHNHECVHTYTNLRYRCLCCYWC